MTNRKKPEDLLKAGAPTKYSKENNERVYRFCLLGATDKQLAVFLGVSEATVNNWKKEYPEFLESIKKGKEEADANVAESMYHRACGYTHPEEKVFNHGGEIITHQTTKHYPPDTQAASLWLRNRQPDKWRDKQEIAVTIDEDAPTTPQVVEKLAELDIKLAELEAQL